MYLSIDSLLNIYSLLIQLMIAMSILMFVIAQRKKERIASKEKAAQYIIRWNEAGFVKSELNVFTSNIDIDKITIENIKDLTNIESVQIICILNFFEEMALSIENELVDERMLNKYFGKSFFEIYTRSEKFINMLRIVRNTEQLYRSLERLYGKWSFNLMLSDTKRINK